jgi:hypothetical protein
MLAQPSTGSWRRPFRFSVRALVVVVLLIGAGLGWIVRQAHVQRDAVAAIMSAGGSVEYDWEWSDGKFVPRGKPPAPRWLLALVGVDYFGHVTSVGLNSSSSTDDRATSFVAPLTQLQSLYLRGSSFGDAGLMNLKGLARLSVLDIRETHVTDAGLATLKGLTSLSELHLSGTLVTDVGLANLKGLKKLYLLHVPGNKVTDVGVNELRRALPNLTIVFFD